MNYSIKQPRYSYEKEFDRIREEYNLKGQIKTVSNIACEYIITSDRQFFETIGEEETKRYFETAYQFVTEYKDLGEQYILSAQVHNDEETPHLHLIFLPVVHKKDKNGNLQTIQEDLAFLNLTDEKLKEIQKKYNNKTSYI